MILDEFNCKLPILYFGHHLDDFISKETPDCEGNASKNAIDLLSNKKSECTRLQICEKRRYTTSYKVVRIFEENQSQVFVAFENPEVEIHNTYVSYDLLSFIGEVGGILGLTLGASLTTFFDSIFQKLPYY